MKKTLLERRRQFIKDFCRGVPLNIIVKGLSDKYGVSEQTIYSDWRRRNSWMPILFNVEDETLILQYIAGLKEVIPAAWTQYVEGDNTAAKVGALRLAKDIYMDLIDILQSIGAVPKKPFEIKAEVKGPPSFPFLYDEEWIRNMREMQDKIRKSRNDSND